ncbi:helix-turn-helix domain-containing protein [Viscerimonas tarda]
MKSISNNKEYRAITKRIDELLEVVSDENFDTIPEAIELEFLSTLIEEYEQQNYPINTPSLSDIIRLRMYELNLNQNQLAKLIGVTPSRISEYMTGKEPTLRIARIICEKLGISANIALGVSEAKIKKQLIC